MPTTKTTNRLLSLLLLVIFAVAGCSIFKVFDTTTTTVFASAFTIRPSVGSHSVVFKDKSSFVLQQQQLKTQLSLDKNEDKEKNEDKVFVDLVNVLCTCVQATQLGCNKIHVVYTPNSIVRTMVTLSTVTVLAVQ